MRQPPVLLPVAVAVRHAVAVAVRHAVTVRHAIVVRHPRRHAVRPRRRPPRARVGPAQSSALNFELERWKVCALDEKAVMRSFSYLVGLASSHT